MGDAHSRWRLGWSRAVAALLALAFLLAACGGADLGQPRGTAIAALAEPTATATATTPPTATRPPPPTATSTPRPLPTPTAKPPTATVTPRPPTRTTNSAVKDFSAWYVGDSDPIGRHRRSYNAATGEYTVQVLEEEQEWSFYSPDTQQFQDFRLEVEAYRAGGPDGTGYGLVFRRQERTGSQQTSERYIFYVTAQGFYGVFYVSAENKTTWLKNLTPASGVAHVGNEPNKLTVVCRGTSLQLLINDREVYRDANLKLNKAGGIGIFALSTEGSGQTTRIGYRNFALTANP